MQLCTAIRKVKFDRVSFQQRGREIRTAAFLPIAGAILCHFTFPCLLIKLAPLSSNAQVTLFDGS